MSSRVSKERRLTPLWIISLFVSLTETVAGIAATQVSGSIQIAFTAFAIGFAVLVAVAFFLILWNRPYVFYSPTEFGKQTDVDQFVKAMGQVMRSRSKTLLLVPEKKEKEESITNTTQESNRFQDYQTIFIFYVIHKQLEKGRIGEILEWFDGFKDEDSLLVNTELALLRAYLARLCGKREAFTRLHAFHDLQLSFYEIAQYELALLKYAKPCRAEEIRPDLKIDSLSIGMRNLWASLLALCYLHEQDFEKTKYYFEMSKTGSMR